VSSGTSCTRCGRFMPPADALIIAPANGSEPWSVWSEDEGEIVRPDCIIPAEAVAGRVFAYGLDDGPGAEVIESLSWQSATDAVPAKGGAS
jgi:hypothetical protein